MSRPAKYTPVLTVSLVKERRRDVPLIEDQADAHKALARYFDTADRELSVVLFLNAKGRVTGIHTAHVGTLHSCQVEPREIFKAAILASASQIILAHNHPSGDPTPSPEDVAVTRRMVEAGKLLDIPVLDHLVIGDPGWTSLRKAGLM